MACRDAVDAGCGATDAEFENRADAERATLVLKRWIRALRVQPPAHNPGFIRLRTLRALVVCPGCGLAALPVRCMHRTLAGQPVRRMRRTHVPGRPRTRQFMARGRAERDGKLIG